MRPLWICFIWTLAVLSAWAQERPPVSANSGFRWMWGLDGKKTSEKNGKRISYQEEEPGYHWKGLLLQSFEFNAIENSFRIFSDDTLRALTANKPFWHDYIASIKQFNMRRWNDGDDFLVNYVGHPMQGAVGAYLEIQNSPWQSRVRWNQPGYWNSRWKAFWWTTLYSTHSEISPLGEAGLGNEGGYTYDVKCILHCGPKDPPSGKDTNNTGWVDFIVTPSVGMLWVFAEDFLDKDISDRIADHAKPDAVYPKIIRGALNPSRSFANLLRGHKPWYRDYDHPITVFGAGIHFTKLENATGDGGKEDRAWPRLQMAPFFRGYSTTVTTSNCLYCRRMVHGGGAQFSLHLWRWLYADAEVAHYPGASPAPSDRAGGNLTTGFFGFRGGINTTNYALNLSLRPGFLQFDDAYLSSPEEGKPAPERGTITHFAWNILLAGDYKLTRNLAIRAGIEETLVRYRQACFDASGIGTPNPLRWLVQGTGCFERPGTGRPPYQSWLSHEDFTNRGSWGYQIGPVFSF
ncbi:hypothetical protein [Pseudacidobacterium ailaaui]|uniref:hypothetical protein n=1 Tax=Pseudacidobacterium ailaaui TaxID=1382359 RepID=UPI0012DBCF9E|nr:hypothetical protein [Pseudacidobacterium ailaaui]